MKSKGKLHHEVNADAMKIKVFKQWCKTKHWYTCSLMKMKKWHVFKLYKLQYIYMYMTNVDDKLQNRGWMYAIEDMPNDSFW